MLPLREQFGILFGSKFRLFMSDRKQVTLKLILVAFLGTILFLTFLRLDDPADDPYRAI